MKRPFLLGLAVLLGFSLLPGSARAGGGFRFRGGVVITQPSAPVFVQPAPSVFPRFVDPWRQWGVPRHSHHVFPHRSSTIFVTPAQPVWVQGFWGWNGFQWVWVPGYWAW